MKIYLQLFWTFFKIGLFSFGGGYAMLPLVQQEITKHHWATTEEITNYYAIGQMTPGIIAVNISAFIGYKVKGIIGVLCTLLGIVLPSLIIISCLAYGFSGLWNKPYVQHAFNGIRLMIPALIIPIALQMIKKSIRDKFCWLLIILAALFCSFTSFSPLIVLLINACVGTLWYQRKKI